ncbi:MAG: replication-relaxation family protein [bacterium]
MSIGKHKMLSSKQIVFLNYQFTTGKQSFWRDYNNYLFKYLDEPYYILVTKNNKQTAMFRLNSRGKKLYCSLTKNKYNTPQKCNEYLPHLYYTNEAIIQLSPYSFELEYNVADLRMDAYCHFENNITLALEVDRGTENKNCVLKKQYKYQRIYSDLSYPNIVLFVTNRKQKLTLWLKKNIKEYYEVVFFVTDINNPNFDFIKNEINIFRTKR